MLAFSFIFSSLSSFAQEPSAYEISLIKSNKMIAVIGVLVIILIGIALYLFSLERKLKKLEERIDSK